MAKKIAPEQPEVKDTIENPAIEIQSDENSEQPEVKDTPFADEIIADGFPAAGLKVVEKLKTLSEPGGLEKILSEAKDAPIVPEIIQPVILDKDVAPQANDETTIINENGVEVTLSKVAANAYLKMVPNAKIIR